MQNSNLCNTQKTLLLKQDKPVQLQSEVTVCSITGDEASLWVTHGGVEVGIQADTVQ